MNTEINRVKKLPLILMIMVMVTVGFLCVFPYIMSFAISITPGEVLTTEGFRLFPSSVTNDSYEFIMQGLPEILRAYLVTIVVTTIGTFIVLYVTLTTGYVISRSNFKFGKEITIYVFVTMIFNAGMTANYMIMTQVLNLDNTIWALILPLTVNPFWIFIAKTYFRTSIPEALMEAATIDGAGEFKVFTKIVLPISKPLIATIGLFSVLAYWNDWFNAQLYIDDPKLTTIQYYLMSMQENITFMKQNAASMGAQMAEMMANLPDQTIIMAVLIVATLPLVIAYPFFQKYFVKGLTVGAVK